MGDKETETKGVADFMRAVADIIETEGDWNGRSMARMAEATADLIESAPNSAQVVLRMMSSGIAGVLKRNGK